MDVKFIRETGTVADYFTINKSAVLPVELLTFTAKPFPNAVQLLWKTETEIQNRGFDLERSTDAFF